MYQTSLKITLPDWIDSFLSNFVFPINSVENRMEMVIALSAENINQQTGGPFAAAIFESDTGTLISIGVNRVVPCTCSIAHAEIMALGLAEQKLHHFNLSSAGIPSLELVTSTEPCAMCMGAIPWAGINKIIYGATDADARSAGFKEGLKPRTWKQHFKQIGIEVLGKIKRKEAALVLQQYRNNNALLYNGL